MGWLDTILGATPGIGMPIGEMSSLMRDAYAAHQMNIFPKNSPLLQLQQQQEIQNLRLQQQMLYPADSGVFVDKAVIDDVKEQMNSLHQSWLTERIEKVRIRGREWLNERLKVAKVADVLAIANNKVPPAVSGREIPWEGTTNGTTVYTKKLRNGDQVYVYPKPEDFFPDRVSAPPAYGYYP